jgi:hypothetical protein
VTESYLLSYSSIYGHKKVHKPATFEILMQTFGVPYNEQTERQTKYKNLVLTEVLSLKRPINSLGAEVEVHGWCRLRMDHSMDKP